MSVRHDKKVSNEAVKYVNAGFCSVVEKEWWRYNNESGVHIVL